jgi:beta-glucosidase
MHYSFPESDTEDNAAAAERRMQDFGGWFGDPAYYGEYPHAIRQRRDSLLPTFKDQDSYLLKRSTDFLALNYYTSDVVRHAAGAGPMEIEVVPQPHRRHTAMGWAIVPEGLHRTLRWLQGRYPGLPIYITENGAALPDQPDDSGFVNDLDRIAYLREHIAATRTAIADGVDVRGYLVWSLLDNLEWSLGFSKRFGLVRCDHETLKRTIKASGYWYANLIADGRLGEAPTATDGGSSRHT